MSNDNRLQNLLSQAILETKSELVEPGYTVFTVQDPAMSHEFRSSSQRVSEDWVQHIKNATVSLNTVMGGGGGGGGLTIASSRVQTTLNFLTPPF